VGLPYINAKPSPSPNPVVYKPKGSNNRAVLLQLGPGTLLIPEVYKVDRGLFTVRIPNLGLLYLGFRPREISLTLTLESSSDRDSLVQFCYNAEDACKLVVVYVVYMRYAHIGIVDFSCK
jgi:hypothetical protein